MSFDRGTWLCALLAVVSFTAVAGCASRQATVESQVAVPEDCARSVGGDIETARRRLEAGRTEEAALYIEGLAGCQDARHSNGYFLLAMDIFEDLGRLNEAWNALKAAKGLPEQSREKAEELRSREEDFETRYVFLILSESTRQLPDVSYAGPVLDDAIRGQLAAIENRNGTQRRDGRYGYWMYPGRYHIDGVLLTLRPGQEIESVEMSRGRRQP